MKLLIYSYTYNGENGVSMLAFIKKIRVDSRIFSKWANSPIRLSKGGQGLKRMGNRTSLQKCNAFAITHLL